jgi:hypothetical protein
MLVLWLISYMQTMTVPLPRYTCITGNKLLCLMSIRRNQRTTDFSKVKISPTCLDGTAGHFSGDANRSLGSRSNPLHRWSGPRNLLIRRPPQLVRAQSCLDHSPGSTEQCSGSGIRCLLYHSLDPDPGWKKNLNPGWELWWAKFT